MAEINEKHADFLAAKDNYEAIMSVYQKVKLGNPGKLADIQAMYARMLVSCANFLGEYEQNLSDRGADLMEARTLYEYSLRM